MIQKKWLWKRLEGTGGSRCKREAEPTYMQVVLKAKIRGAGDGVKATQAARIETQHEGWIGR